MAWIIGIDEAGYGPNLGPFVMTAVSCRVPDEVAQINLWQLLGRAVRQAGDPDDGRLLIDDSKVVYSTSRGLLGLERGVQAALAKADSLRALLEATCANGLAELSSEVWFAGDRALPVAAEADDLAALAQRFTAACGAAGVAEWRVRCALVCPMGFNALLDEAGSKGAVLAHCLESLLRRCHAETTGNDAVNVFVDKHGGRNTYAAYIQHALPDGVVLAEEECMARSRYRVHGLHRDIRLTFQPRADAEHFCVALASMTSKYVRELCMAEFNRYWLQKVPGLKPTAGYPGDAVRFWDAIRPAAAQLGLTETQVWRRK